MMRVATSPAPRRYIPHSPLEGLQVKLANKRKRTLEDPELKDVWQAALKQGYPHGTVVQLLHPDRPATRRNRTPATCVD